ncbi:MAG: DUF1592 domain-containing protein [Planctomycetaceae bacterium]|nr:DUF1592 domain-containing protein [Planctomycetaceae bacterium]
MNSHSLVRLCLIVLFSSLPRDGSCEDPIAFDKLEGRFETQVLPLLRKHCLDCHSTEAKEGELDLQRFAGFADIRRDPAPWQRVEQMIREGEMPPEDSPPLSDEERDALLKWVREYLHAEARANAGDPGPVVLRRLTNSEYRYTVHDLTGIDLNPTRDFPVDGAAGEGFTNVGSAMAMSPTMVTKYLDAARQVASHAVLVPEGIRFSEKSTRRDWTNDLVDQIRELYRKHTSGETNVDALDRWSIPDPRKSTENDGRVELAPYFAALIENHDELTGNPAAGMRIGQETGLNGKYLTILADNLLATLPESLLLQRISQRLKQAGPSDAIPLANEIRAWQNVLWRFQAVGHFGIVRPWQVPETPLPESTAVRIPLTTPTEGEFPVSLHASATKDDAEIVWQRPRIEFPDRSPLLLRDLPAAYNTVKAFHAQEGPRAKSYLDAVAELHRGDRSLADVAKEKSLDADLLDRWTQFLDLGKRVDRSVNGHLTNRITSVAGYASLNGWDGGGLPSIITNTSEEVVNFVTITMPPRAVAVHPTPDRGVAVVWRSPVSTKVAVSGTVNDADDKCGNGADWSVTLLTSAGQSVLANGTIDNGRAAQFATEESYPISEGDLISLTVSPRNRDHSCDTTAIDLSIKEVNGAARAWTLSQEVVDDILTSNPQADNLGHEAVWHFVSVGGDEVPKSVVPENSTLAEWRKAVLDGTPNDKLAALTSQIELLARGELDGASEPDQQLARLLADWNGPLQWRSFVSKSSQNDTLAADDDFGIVPTRFGKTPSGKTIDSASLSFATPNSWTFQLPAELVAGGEFVVEGTLAPSSEEAAAQFVAQLGQSSDPKSISTPATPYVSRAGSSAREEVELAYDDFRQLFPAAMCHARIVPVDEVVTLVLFHREDDHLARLMLDDQERQRLERLWKELRFVSQDALTILTGYEQLMEFATQDADPSVFVPLKDPIEANAKRFREDLAHAEPSHVDAVLKLADGAWRRPLTDAERTKLTDLYDKLRAESVPHEEAIRLLITRLLTSPAFLYKLETPGPASEPVPVADYELASRFSYFLWSSLPDQQLRARAESGELQDPVAIKEELHRLVQDDHIRRLAIEFGCQWLHVLDFDQHDEKNEQQFPEFTEIREELYEESILYFTDFFQQNRSVLSLLDGNRLFVNGELARFYGVPVSNEGWQLMENAREHHRGGILTLGSVLSKQSGASRTSPILRGNWVSETLLGERLPRPPKNVPVLPETAPAGLTERQLIERHSSDKACAKCHARIDPFGFALESYDGIGRFREQDQAGHPIDTTTTLDDGTPLTGVDGLRDYLANQRRDQFVHHFCKKLLGYALGRSVQLSDEPLIEEMMARLEQQDFQILAAVETIVLSDQFRTIRGREQVESAAK